MGSAFRTAGQPCAYRAAFEGGAPPPGPQPMVQQQPGPVVVTPTPAPMATTKVYPKCDPRRGIVDNCTS
jgi:hypothetical protein